MLYDEKARSKKPELMQITSMKSEGCILGKLIVQLSRGLLCFMYHFKNQRHSAIENIFVSK